MMKKAILVTVALALVAMALPGIADDEKVRSGDYFTAGVVGDVSVVGCGEGDDVPSYEDLTNHCLGGYSFLDLAAGNWEISVADDGPFSPISGAYRIEPTGGTIDECFPTTAEGVADGNDLVVWIDGVVWWAQFQPCSPLTPSQGTTGTITITLL